MGDKTQMNGGGITFAGRYKQLDELGEGSFASVYKAQDTQTGQIVAVKVLDQKLSRDKDLLQRFLNEAEAQQKLDHPNVVKAFASGVEQTPGMAFHFLVMEYIEKIAQSIIRNKFTAQAKLAGVIRQAALGLAHAHQNGLVHRDVKPENILTAYLEPNTEKVISKISDFGIARNEDMRLTLTGTTMGTPYYMSPEQAEGAKELDHRTDIYGLGATAYHILTGIPPFSEYVIESKNAALVLNAKLERKPFTPPNQLGGVNMPPFLEAIVMKAMADDPSKRHQSMLELVDEIDIFLSGEPKGSLNSTFFGDSPAKIARRPRTTRHEQAGNKKYVWAGIGGAIAAAVLGGALLFSGGDKKPARQPQPPPAPRKPAASPLEVPRVKVPTPLEQYMKIEPQASALKADIAKFLAEGSTDLDKLDSLKSRIGEIQPRVSGFQVEAAQVMSKSLFSDLEKLAERSPLVKGYHNLERRAGAILDDAGMALGQAELSQTALERSARKLSEASAELGEYKGKLDTGRLEGRLASCSSRVARSLEALKKKAKPVVEAPKIEPPKSDPPEDAYSSFSKQLSEELFPAVAKYGESAGYDTRKLEELMARVKDARAEAGKYAGREGAQELSDRLESCEEELKAFESFMKGRGRSLLSEIARYEEFLTRKGGLLEKPNKRDVATSIRRAQYFIERLAKYGKPAEPKIRELKALVARMEGQKEEPNEAAVDDAAEDSVLHITFDEGTVVYENGKWVVKDLSGNNNHGTLHGNFAGDVETGRSFVYARPADIPAQYDLALVLGKSGRRRDYSMGLLGRKGHIDFGDLGIFEPSAISVLLDFYRIGDGGEEFSCLIFKQAWPNHGYNIALLRNEIIWRVLGQGTGKRQDTSYTLPVLNNRWYNVIATCNGSNAVLYVDGVQRAIKPVKFNPKSSSPLTVGKDCEFNSGHYNGLIDNIIIINNPLTSSAIRDLRSGK